MKESDEPSGAQSTYVEGTLTIIQRTRNDVLLYSKPCLVTGVDASVVGNVLPKCQATVHLHIDRGDGRRMVT